jgi:hypothetical protein
MTTTLERTTPSIADKLEGKWEEPAGRVWRSTDHFVADILKIISIRGVKLEPSSVGGIHISVRVFDRNTPDCGDALLASEDRYRREFDYERDYGFRAGPYDAIVGNVVHDRTQPLVTYLDYNMFLRSIHWNEMWVGFVVDNFVEYLRGQIHELILHEVDEVFLVGGHRIYDPHNTGVRPAPSMALSN